MRIALVSSEVVGFAKTGGLADVAGALPPALENLGEEVIVFLPMYHCIRKTGNFESTKVRFQIPLGPNLVPGSLAKSKIPGSNVTIYLVENPDLFERDNPSYGRGLYQFAGSEGAKKDYPDNSARFYFFNEAVLASFPQLGFWPDVVHWNDWQSGLGPVLLREKYDHSEDRALAEKYQKV
ncbi:MAG: glycogen synthase GlgA, partial [Planctomycetes bacterium]|nr:glycogen synthase GlgA [Planctomycetota bacterium]